MSFQTVPASQGLKWITDAVNLILRNPGPYLLMGLVVAVMALVPLLGTFALAILGPALYGGIMYAAREHEGGGTADFKHLFQAFNEPGKLPKMLLLCLPGIAAGIIIAIFGVFLLGGALIGAGISSTANSDAGVGASIGIGLLFFFVLTMAVGIFTYALTFFATPRVMLDDAEAIPAMQESLRACAANIGALLVYVGILIGASLLVVMIIGMLSPTLAQLVLLTPMVPVVAVATYNAWRDVFGGRVTQEMTAVDGAPVVPPAPPAPPTPPPSFEA